MCHSSSPFTHMFALVNSFRTHVDRDLGRSQLHSVHDLCLHSRFRCSYTRLIVAMSQKQLPRREIGNTGIKASVLSFGASPLGSVFEVSLVAHASAVCKPVRHADLGLPRLDVIREAPAMHPLINSMANCELLAVCAIAFKRDVPAAAFSHSYGRGGTMLTDSIRI